MIKSIFRIYGKIDLDCEIMYPTYENSLIEQDEDYLIY